MKRWIKRSSLVPQHRRVLFTLREKVDIELERLQILGIIYPVKNAKRAAPLITVLKKNGQIQVLLIGAHSQELMNWLQFLLEAFFNYFVY